MDYQFLRPGEYLVAKNGDRLISENGRWVASFSTIRDILYVNPMDAEGNVFRPFWQTKPPATELKAYDNGSVYLTVSRDGQVIVGATVNGERKTSYAFGQGYSGDGIIPSLILGNDGNLMVVDDQQGPKWSAFVDLNTEDDSPDAAQAKTDWLEAANYDKLRYGESVFIVYFGNHEYRRADDDTIHQNLAAVKSGVIVTKNLLGPQFSVVAQASVMDTFTHQKSIDSVDVHIFDAEAQAQLSSNYIGAGASLNLIKTSASIFDLTLGAGVDTGFGIKDDSVTIKALGTGITVGRKIGISVLGSSFDIDAAPVLNLIFDL